MARFVLVHGAWHGAWCLSDLVRELKSREHGARVIELDSGHSPFLTQPGELADVLASLA